MKELLDELRVMSGGGHPGDYIDEKTAEIAIVTVYGVKKILVTWEDGFANDAERERYYEDLAMGGAGAPEKKTKKRSRKKAKSNVIQLSGRRLAKK